MSFCGEHDEHRINEEGIRMGLDPAFSAWVPCEDYREQLVSWLRKVALFSNDHKLADEAFAEHLRLTGEEPKL